MASLDFDDLLRTIKSKGPILPAYYLYGDEDLLKDEAVRDLIAAAIEPSMRDFNMDRRRAADVSADEFQSLALTPPMLTQRRAVVLTEVEDLQQKRARAQSLRAAVLSYLEKPLPETLLLLVQSAGEKTDGDLIRRATSVDFKRLQPKRVVRWVGRRATELGLEIEEDATRLLVAALGDDLPLLAAELSKLRAAVSGRKVTGQDVEDLVGVRHGETVGDFTAAVTGRRFAQAADMVGLLLSSPGSSGVRLLMTLGTTMTALALARSVLDTGAGESVAADRVLATLKSSRPMGLGNWDKDAERWARDAAEWSAEELENALELLLRADRRLKATSLGGEEDLVREAVLSMGAARVAA